MEQKWVKLAPGVAQHFDRDLKFHIRQGECKLLPEVIPAGSLTAQRRDMRAFVPCDPPADATEPDKQDVGAQRAVPARAPHPDPLPLGGEGTDQGVGAPFIAPVTESDDDLPTTVEALAEVRDRVIERRIERLQDDNSAAQLREMAAELGLQVQPRANKRSLAAEIAVAEWRGEHTK